MSATITDVWPDVLAAIRHQVGEARYDLWFRHTKVHRVVDDTIEIGAPNLFIAAWLENHFRDVVVEVVRGRAPEMSNVRFVATGELYREARREQNDAMAALVAEHADDGAEGTGAPRPAEPEQQRSHGNARVRGDYTFDTFIVGPCNRLAHASAVEVAGNPHCQFNPLFLHSHCGLGKTHLMQAIWHALHQLDDGRRAEYVSAEAFTNEFTYAMRNGRLDAFRHKYRGVDVLLIDDVHFFNNKTALQEELLHTFDALDSAHKQVVLASDAHPNSMSALKKGLVSRFMSGMVVRLEPPSYEIRLAIVRMQAQRLRRQMGEAEIEHIAQRFDDNIRELQGAVHTALAYAALHGGRVTVPMLRELFAAQARGQRRATAIERIEQRVAEEFRVSVEDLHSKKRTRTVALPRQVCLYLGRKLTSLSCAELARRFGSRHHTTVLFAEKRVRERMTRDAEFTRRVGDVEAALRNER